MVVPNKNTRVVSPSAATALIIGRICIPSVLWLVVEEEDDYIPVHGLIWEEVEEEKGKQGQDKRDETIQTGMK